MFPIRVKTVQESDLRMLGSLARNIQRVLPVTQADIDAAAALGKGWVVWKVFEVSDPLDNLRGGTQLIIRQNSIQPGQNVRRVIFVAGPGGQTVVIRGTDYIALPDAIANSLSYVKAFGGTEQNGTPTPDAPVDIVSNNGVLKVNLQGQIYTDGTVETINVHGKNLYNPATMFSSTAMASGLYWCYTANGKSIKVPCKPNTTYTLTYTGGNRCFIGGFTNDVPLEPDSRIRCDFNIFVGSSSSVSPKTFTTPENCYYVCCGLANSSSIEVTNIQLEEGSTATDYQPYFDGGTATAEMLLKVGDYTDEQEVIGGVVTKKIGVYVFDGSEEFQNGTNGWISGAAITDQVNAAYFPFCTHFVGTNTTPVAASNTVRVYRTSGNVGRVYFGLDKSITEFSTAAKFQQWVADQYAAGTPVIIVYVRATPTTESVAGQTLQVTDGDNVVEITQAGMDGLELEVQYDAAVSLTVQEVEDANLDNNVTVTIQ